MIAKLKLCRLELAGFLIATRIGTAARRNLGNAEFQRPLPDSRFFPSGHDNARVRHGKAQYGDKLEKILIVQGVRRPGGQIRPDGRFDAAR